MVIVSPLAGVVPVPNGQPLELSQRVACIPNSWHSLTLDRQSFHHQTKDAGVQFISVWVSHEEKNHFELFFLKDIVGGFNPSEKY